MCKDKTFQHQSMSNAIICIAPIYVQCCTMYLSKFCSQDSRLLVYLVGPWYSTWAFQNENSACIKLVLSLLETMMTKNKFHYIATLIKIYGLVKATQNLSCYMCQILAGWWNSELQTLCSLSAFLCGTEWCIRSFPSIDPFLGDQDAGISHSENFQASRRSFLALGLGVEIETPSLKSTR